MASTTAQEKERKRKKRQAQAEKARAADTQTAAEGTAAPAADAALSGGKKKAAAPSHSKAADVVMWFVVWVSLLAAVVGNYMMTHQGVVLYQRILFVVGCCVLSLVVFLFTYLGKRTVKFAKDSRNELRRVTWPTKQETVQTSVVVAIVVFIVSVGLWFFDIIISWLVSTFNAWLG